MKVLLVGLDAAARPPIEHGAKLVAEVEVVTAEEAEALTAAGADDLPATVVISDSADEPIRLAQSLAAIDRDIAITILCTAERQDQLRQSLRFAPLVSPNTSCRLAEDLEQVGVDVVEAGQAALRRREHRVSVAAATEQLRNSAEPRRLHGEVLGRLVESAPIGIVTLDSRQTVAAWNTYAAAIVGASEREVLGRSVYELFEVAERERLAELLEHAVAARPGLAPTLLRRVRRGAEQFVEVSAAPIAADTGERGMLLVLDDVSERIRVERAHRRAEQAQAFLAETGALLDTSLDPVETLQRIASLAVPDHAELCLIDLLTEEGAIEGVAFSAVDEDVALAVEDIRRRFPVEALSSHPVARVLRTGRPELLEEMTDHTYRQIAQGDDHLALMRRLHYHSALVAPLTARGRTFGAISLLYLDEQHRYAHDDLRVLEDVARRAALALDNASLYARERRIAETLQRSLLPSRLPELPGVALAAHYEPGEGDVGGDWYDAIPLPGGRLGCVVGDIVGRGIEAASAMGQLRNAVRVYALERDGPAEVVEAVDRLAESLGIAQMATLVYAVFEPDETVVISSAGHPPPLIVTPDGNARYVMDGRSGPIGVGFAEAHTEVREPFTPGSLLLMYTDGLIERRGESLDEGLAKLQRAGAGAPLEPRECADHIVGALRPGAHADDVALLVVKASVVTDRLRLSFPAEPPRVAAVRTELRRWLGGRLPAEDVYDVLIACSEACANAVEHAYALDRGTVEVEGEVTDDELRLTVRDSGRWRTGGSSNRGRGIPTMKAAMDAVEVTTDASGTEVVMRRRLPATAAA